MRKRPFLSSRSILSVSLVSLSVAGVADVFFFGHPLGWTLGLFALLLLGVTLWRHGMQCRRRPLLLITVAIAALAGAMFMRVGVLAPALAMGLAVACSIIARHGWTLNAREWLKRCLMFCIPGSFTFASDLLLISRVKGHVCKKSHRKLHLLGWVLPIVLSLVFVFFFAVANPVLDSWLIHLGHWIDHAWLHVSELIRTINEWLSPGRIVLWIVTFSGAWALLRFRCSLFREKIIRRNQPPREKRNGPAVAYAGPVPNAELSGFYSTRVAVRCLVLFNIVFLIQSLMDVVYLWGGAALPEAMSHAEYAHRGAYPLVFTTLLAAVFVLVTFQPGGRLQEMRIARRLVYLWLAQNLFLTVNAVFRLKLYVDAFDLTRLRVASAIWMGLVLGGVVLILWRIVRRHSNNWLIGVNAAMAFGVLYLCAFLPFDGWIAGYNLGHCYEISGEGNALDVDYLYRLGPAALPAMDEVRLPAFDQGKADKAAKYKGMFARQLAASLEDWQGWTWRRSRLARRFPAEGVPDEAV